MIEMRSDGWLLSRGTESHLLFLATQWGNVATVKSRHQGLKEYTVIQIHGLRFSDTSLILGL